MWPVSGASKPVLSFQCAAGRGCCVSAKHRVIVVSCIEDDKLYVYDLDSGQLLRTLGLGTGREPGQLMFSYGGLCLGFSGDTVMVADYCNGRVSELALSDGAHVAHHGPLESPQWMDCDSGTQTLLITSTNFVTLLHVQTKRVQRIAPPATFWIGIMPARYCSNGQAFLMHYVDGLSSHYDRMSLSGEVLESVHRRSTVMSDVVIDFDADTGPMETLITTWTDTVGPLRAVQLGNRRSSLWHNAGADVNVNVGAGGPYSSLVPLRDGSGTLVVRKRNCVHVLRNPERDLRWAWIAATAVAFAWFSNVQNTKE